MKKDIILDLLKKERKQFTAEQIYDIVSKDTKINLSTVYRALNNYTDKGILKKIVRQDKITYYELNDENNDYCIVCDKCKKTYLCNNKEIEKVVDEISKENNFSIEGYTFELHGLCNECKKASRNN